MNFNEEFYDPSVIYQLRPRKVCVCLGISREEFIDVIQKYKIQNFEKLQEITRCSTGCGICKDEVLKILKEFKD